MWRLLQAAAGFVFRGVFAGAAKRRGKVKTSNSECDRGQTTLVIIVISSAFGFFFALVPSSSLLFLSLSLSSLPLFLPFPLCFRLRLSWSPSPPLCCNSPVSLLRSTFSFVSSALLLVLFLCFFSLSCPRPFHLFPSLELPLLLSGVLSFPLLLFNRRTRLHL